MPWLKSATCHTCHRVLGKNEHCTWRKTHSSFNTQTQHDKLTLMTFYARWKVNSLSFTLSELVRSILRSLRVVRLAAMRMMMHCARLNALNVPQMNTVMLHRLEWPKKRWKMQNVKLIIIIITITKMLMIWRDEETSMFSKKTHMRWIDCIIHPHKLKHHRSVLVYKTFYVNQSIRLQIQQKQKMKK